MQPTEPVPSNAQPTADAQANAEPVSEQAEGASQSGWRGALARMFRGSSEDQAEETQAPPQPSTIALTQEELDRRVQAETDRREYKRQADAQAAERRRLRDEDPWAYAELDRNAEQWTQQASQTNTQMSQLLGQAGAEHDKYTLDPLVSQLPEAERKRIMDIQGAGVGLDGRKLIVTEGLKALEKQWKEQGAKEAEQKLRRNAAFRKQVLSEFRRGAVEPEFIGSGSASAEDEKVSDILRNQIRQRH